MTLLGVRDLRVDFQQTNADKGVTFDIPEQRTVALVGESGSGKSVTALSILGWIYFNSPSGFLIAVLLGVMLKMGHPAPWDQTPLDAKRKAVAFLTLIIFVLCFTPFPIKIT